MNDNLYRNIESCIIKYVIEKNYTPLRYTITKLIGSIKTHIHNSTMKKDGHPFFNEYYKAILVESVRTSVNSWAETANTTAGTLTREIIKNFEVIKNSYLRETQINSILDDSDL